MVLKNKDRELERAKKEHQKEVEKLKNDGEKKESDIKDRHNQEKIIRVAR